MPAIGCVAVGFLELRFTRKNAGLNKSSDRRFSAWIRGGYLFGLLVLAFFCPSPLRFGASLCGGAGGCAEVAPWGSRSLLLVPWYCFTVAVLLFVFFLKSQKSLQPLWAQWSCQPRNRFCFGLSVNTRAECVDFWPVKERKPQLLFCHWGWCRGPNSLACQFP